MSDPSYIYVVCIQASPERVWEGLTNPEFTEQYWFGGRCQTDWSKGAKVRMERDGGVDFEGVVLESDPPRRLVWTFRDARDQGDPSETVVAYDLLFANGVTRLTMTHSNFADDSPLRKGIARGWPVLLSGLKTWLERGEPMPASFELMAE